MKEVKTVKKLKGHVQVILKDAKTGKIDQIIEGDNIVTDAVGDLLANNVLGCVDYTKIYPLWSRWFKGCLAFEQPFAEVNGAPDPADYFIPDDSVNHVVAHAGDVSPDDIADDLKRGNPNTHVEVITENSVRMCWEWGPQQALGNISSIALTHRDIGNCGTGANSNTFRSLQPFDVINIGLSNFNCYSISKENVIGQYNDHYGIWFTIGEHGEFANLNSIFQTTKITLHFKKLGYDKFGLYDTTTVDDQFDEYLEVDLGPANYLYCQPAYFWDKANKQLHLFTNITGFDSYNNLTWNNVIQHYTITIPNMTDTPSVNIQTLATDRIDLAPLCFDQYGSGSYRGSRPYYQSLGHNSFNGNDYWYFPCSDNVRTTSNEPYVYVKGYLRVGGGHQIYCAFVDTQYEIRSAMSGKGICPIVMSGRVINSGVGYTCQDQFPINQSWRVKNWAPSTPEAISSYVVPLGASQSYEAGRYIVANKFVMTTKFNLPTTVTKSASQSMTIVYTLTEV